MANIIAKIIFKNFVTGEIKSKKIFSECFILKGSFSEGSPILIPIGDKSFRTIFGRGAQIFQFTVEKIEIRNGQPLLILEEMEFPRNMEEWFKENWKGRKKIRN